MEKLIAKEWKLIENCLFEDNDGGIEHVDDSYKGFKVQITMALERMYLAGKASK